MVEDIVWVSRSWIAWEIFNAEAVAEIAINVFISFFFWDISRLCVFKRRVFVGVVKRTLRFFSSWIFLKYIFSKSNFISKNSGGKSTLILSNSRSWRYCFTSGESLVLISNLQTPRFSQSCWIVFLSAPGEAVSARTFGFVAWDLYFCAMAL